MQARVTAWALTGLVCGCSFNSDGGNGLTAATLASGEGDASSGSAIMDEDEGSSTTSAGNTTQDSAVTTQMTTTPASESDSGSDSAGETNGPQSCPPDPPFAELVMAEDAEVTPPATHAPGWQLSGDPDVAYSEVAGEGTINFDFEVPCDGSYYLWALVWDRENGTGDAFCGNTANADSLRFYVDDPGFIGTFNYGCGTCFMNDGVWSWQPLNAHVACLPVWSAAAFTAGAHSLTLINQSTGDINDNDVAAVAAVVIADDPAFDPSTLYAP